MSEGWPFLARNSPLNLPQRLWGRSSLTNLFSQNSRAVLFGFFHCPTPTFFSWSFTLTDTAEICRGQTRGAKRASRPRLKKALPNIYIYRCIYRCIHIYIAFRSICCLHVGPVSKEKQHFLPFLGKWRRFEGNNFCTNFWYTFWEAIFTIKLGKSEIFRQHVGSRSVECHIYAVCIYIYICCRVKAWSQNLVQVSCFFFFFPFLFFFKNILPSAGRMRF